MVQSFFIRVDNIEGKGANVGYRIFSFTNDVFKGPLSQGCLKSALGIKEFINTQLTLTKKQILHNRLKPAQLAQWLWKEKLC